MDVSRSQLRPSFVQNLRAQRSPARELAPEESEGPSAERVRAARRKAASAGPERPAQSERGGQRVEVHVERPGRRDPFAGASSASELFDRFLQARHQIGDRMRNAIAHAEGEGDALAFRQRGARAANQLDERFLRALEAFQPAAAKDGAHASAEQLLDNYLKADQSLTQALRADVTSGEHTPDELARMRLETRSERDALQDRLMNALGFGPPAPVASAEPGEVTEEPAVGEVAADVDVEGELADRLFDAIATIDDRTRNALAGADSAALADLFRERAAEARDGVAQRFLNALSFERGNSERFAPDPADRRLISDYLDERFKLEGQLTAKLEAASGDEERGAILARFGGELDLLTQGFLDSLSRPPEAPEAPLASGSFAGERVAAPAADTQRTGAALRTPEAEPEGEPASLSGLARIFRERFATMLERTEQRAENLLGATRGEEARQLVLDRLARTHERLETRFQHALQQLRAGAQGGDGQAS